MTSDIAILSEGPPRPARSAGLGDRFRYWRGASGRRYLFSVVPAEALADFRSCVVMLADPTADGRFLGRALFAIEAEGGRPAFRQGSLVFVHLLATSERDRRRMIDDLSARPLRLAA